MEQRRRERERAEAERISQGTARAQTYFYDAPPAPEDHPYLARKGITKFDHIPISLKVDGAGNLLVPLQDIDGRFMTFQRIPPEEGIKRFAEGAKAGGGFALLGDLAAGDILVCEGFATAATIHETRGQGGPTLAAMSAGNLKAVCQALRQRCPGRRGATSPPRSWCAPSRAGTSTSKNSPSSRNADRI